MSINLNIPSREDIKKAGCVVAGVSAAIIIIKVITGIAEKVKEKKQDKSIKKLKEQVADLEARLDILEASNV